MDGLLLVARLLLAGVFAIAGAAKILDLAGTRRAVVDFGAPAAFAGPLSVGLPVAELTVAVALLPRVSARVSAAAALVLLLTFLAAVVINLANGRKPKCRCFGRLGAAVIGPWTVASNLGLIAIAGFVLGFGDADPGTVAWLGDLSPSERVALTISSAASVLLTAVVVQLWMTLRDQGRRLRDLEQRLAKAANKGEEGLPVGSAAPAFSLDALGGGVVTLDSLLAARLPVLLVFTDPDCDPCKALLPKLGRWQRDYASHVTIAVVSEGTAADNHPNAIRYGLGRVLLQRKAEVADAYQCLGAPGAVLVLPEGTIGSPIAGGGEQIEQLVAFVVGSEPAETATGIVGRRSLHILGRGTGGIK